MDSSENQPPDKSRRNKAGAKASDPVGSYGGGAPGLYPGYGAGGYPGYGEAGPHRGLDDYLLIVRERLWYIVAGFLAVLAATAAYTFTRTPLYESTATAQIFRRNPTVMQMQQVVDNDIRGAEDLNTQINILNSAMLSERVAGRLDAAQLKRFLAPYEEGRPDDAAPLNPRGIITSNRTIVAQRGSLVVAITYQHPDPETAALVANLFADEYISYSTRIQVEESLKAVVELEQRANEQRIKVDGIAKALQSYREQNNMVSLDQRKDIVTQRLKELSGYVTQATAALQAAETRWKQVQETRTRGEDLLTLPFVASVPAVSQLQQQVASSRITVAQLSERYRAQHPRMIEAARSLAEAEQQLKLAINTTTAQVESIYRTAEQNLAQAQAALAAQEEESLTLDRFAVEYTNLERDYEVNEKLLQSLLARMQETSMSSSMEIQNARLIDRAMPRGSPASPNVLLNLAIGVAGGLGFGLALAFAVAFADDRVKSSYDIETVIGLPLLSIIPKFKNPAAVADAPGAGFGPRKEPEIAEAFSTLYSSLRMREDSKDARSILVTSTVPGEGKSFITRNLALTFASHGERVLVIDCDLRRPVMHRAFNIDNLKGTIDLCKGVAPDEVIVKDVQPGLDVIASGGRSKSPAQNLSSKEFAAALAALRKRYDRIFIDTPPVALVSDALVILPLVDGSIYSIFFNKVRRKAVQFCVQRMSDLNVPSFGAVLNGLDQNIGGYYYQHYYDKSYKQYYVTEAGAEGARD